MQNSDSFHTVFTSHLAAFSRGGLEAIAWCIALVCSIVDITWRCILQLFKYSVKLLFQLTFILLLASIFLLAYAVIMAISVAFGPGISSQVS